MWLGPRGYWGRLCQGEQQEGSPTVKGGTRDRAKAPPPRNAPVRPAPLTRGRI